MIKQSLNDAIDAYIKTFDTYQRIAYNIAKKK